MGNPMSKFEDSGELKKTISLSTPAVTTPSKYMELDPRSPSCNVARTPIEIINSKSQDQLLLKEDTPVQKTETCRIINIDPRSPTTEFIRTPIVAESDENRKVSLLKNTQNNLRKHLSTGELNKDSAVINAKVVENIPGLLETNIDDVLPPIRIEELSSSLKRLTPFKKSPEKVLVDKEVQADVADELNKSPSIETNTIAVQTNVDESSILYTPKVERSALDLITKKQCTESSLQSKAIIMSPSVAEFDRKLTNLIFQSELLESEVKQFKTHEKVRTPLGTLDFNTKENILKPKLRVSDKPTKVNSGSKIPVLREKKMKEKTNRFSLQCENTMPIDYKSNKESTPKSKVTKWDKDNTLII